MSSASNGGDPRQHQHAVLENLRQAMIASGQQVDLFETHISWVLVTPATAWKFKKAIRLDILDFTTLKARRECCLEELRLNRRLAGELYLGLDAVTGSAQSPQLVDASECAGPILEFAVRMRAFPQEALWDNRAQRGVLGFDEAAGLGQLLGQFHLDADAAPSASDYGDPARLLAVSRSNRHEIATLLGDAAAQRMLDQVGKKLEQEHATLRPYRLARKQQGRVRECHGDLHCSNLLTLDGHALAFDCIEFNPVLRWIDVIDDIAFAVMDLRLFGQDELAACLLDAWLQVTGDYGGLPLLNAAMAERALVRCKVGLLRAGQQQAQAALSTRSAALDYLALAAQCLEPRPARIIITHGFSGSGKSSVAAALARALGAVRLRSDVERKRLRGMLSNARPGAEERQALYADPARQQIYAHLAQQATHVVRSGLTAIVDATFLQSAQRALLFQSAAQLHVPISILDCQCDPALLRDRIAARLRAGADPSDADLGVLAQQLAHHEMLTNTERARAFTVDTQAESAEDAARRVAALIDRAT